jgi:hypothetical protein
VDDIRKGLSLITHKEDNYYGAGEAHGHDEMTRVFLLMKYENRPKLNSKSGILGILACGEH